MDLRLMMDKKVFLVLFVGLFVSTMLIIGYVAQPTSEIQSIWTPDSYRNANIAGQENVQAYAAQFGGTVLYISLEDFQKSFKEKCTIIVSSHEAYHNVYYLGEADGVAYVAVESYSKGILSEADKAILSDDGQLSLSYSTRWLTTIMFTILSTLACGVVSHAFSDDIAVKIYRWRNRKSKKSNGLPTG